MSININKAILYIKNNILLTSITIFIVLFILGYAFLPTYNKQETEVIKQDEVTSISQTLINQVKKDNSKSFINPYNISIPSDVEKVALSRLQQDLNVYKFSSYTPSEISSLFTANSEVIEGYGYRLTGLNNSDFLSDYLNLLNTLGVGVFSIQKTSEVVESSAVTLHGGDAYVGNDGLVRVTIYNLFLDGKIILVSNHLSEVVLVESLEEGKVLKIDFPNFIPKKVDGLSKQIYTEGTYNFYPAYNTGGGFDELLYLSGADLPNASNFNIADGSLGIVYVYYPEQGILVPHLSKTAYLSGGNYSELKNKQFYLISN